MKKILLIAAFLPTLYASAQVKISDLTPYYSPSDSALVPVVISGTNRKVYGRDLVKGRMDSLINALAVYVQKQTQSPTGTLTGGATIELMATGADLPYTLNWSAGRTAATSTSLATANISTINVAGTNETFSNPAAGAIVSGTQAVTVVRNSNTAFQITVTTADAKTATANTSVVFQPKRYWFYSTSATPATSDVLAALGGGSELSTSIAKSNFTITTSGGNQYISYAYPSGEGALSSINIGGFESIGSFTQRTVSVTNASGYVQNYFVYTSNNQLPTTTINSAQ